MQYVAVPLADEVVRFVQSSSEQDMQAKVEQALAQFLPNSGLTSFELAGGGDGGVFMSRLGFTPMLGETNIEIYFYMAADELELPAHRVAALAEGRGPMFRIIDEPIAGASKGTPFMNAIVIARGR